MLFSARLSTVGRKPVFAQTSFRIHNQRMNFSSPIFLFLFLPVVLTLYHLLPGTRLRNLWLLLTSLVFYAWGEIDFTVLLVASTLMNYGLGLWVSRAQKPGSRKTAVVTAVAINIGLLAFFKYGNLLVTLLDSGRIWLGLSPGRASHIPLPIGISFFTFHALSYIVDVYRGKWEAARDPRQVALYIFFFPQLIAGPILRWSGIAPQLQQRTVTREGLAEGIRRFSRGLAKKVLLANTLATPADQIFSLSAAALSTADAWLGIVCYTLQIYFDFSGYSDMAVGLGKMFGFKFLENFDFPYVAQSIRDFWRRWHISLSTWFRDYLYIPLGGNRGSGIRTHLNLLLVFLLCGLWHGASLTFVVWGLYHGLFLVLERTGWGSLQSKLPRSLRHAYTLLAVMLGWVIFRAETFAAAKSFILALLGLGSAAAPQPWASYASGPVLAALLLGCLCSGPSWQRLTEASARWLEAAPVACRSWVNIAGQALELTFTVSLLVLSAAWLASGTYNPFIYYRF
jgi:alginate O-acetyltransferase complex protein AlgI